MGAAAIPLATTAGSMIFGKLFGGPSKQQKAGMAGTQAAQAQLGAAAPQLQASGMANTAQGASGVGASQNYYKQLLGSKAALNGAIAPQLQQVSDYYKGAEGNATRGLRGGARDYALAELDRQKVGQLAMIPATARAGAAKDLVGASAPLLEAGAAQTGQGIQAAGGAANAGTQLFNQGTTAYGQQAGLAKGFGSMLFDAISNWQKGRGGGGGGGGSTFFPVADPSSGVVGF